MGIDLYYVPGSSPCRSVLLTAKALGLELNLKLTNLQTGDHLKPDFIKINPQHTVPTLVDNGFALWESRAIITYLVNKYGKGSSLYPADPQERALVDQRLYFDMGTLGSRFGDYYYPQFFGGAPADPAKLVKLDEAMVLLNQFLAGQTYVAGKNLTVADLSIVTIVSTLAALNYDLSKYPNVIRWLKHIETTAKGYKEANQDGVDAFKAMIEAMKKK